MVKIERTPTPPASLAIEASKAHGSYSQSDVIQQLLDDFHHKCYICELRDPPDIQVEHLRPHYNRSISERVFDWDNLFLSCPHCNHVKASVKYDDKVLDCCKADPEQLLEHIFECSTVSVYPKAPSAQMTAELIQECFEKRNTAIREYECERRVNLLAADMNVLYRTLSKHKAKPTNRTLRSLRGMLSRSSEFAAFKRSYVRRHLQEYPDLADFVS